MMTRDTRGETTQANLFKPLLRDIVSQKHPLVLLADSIDWKSFEDALESRFCADNGRPSCPVRLMVGLQYLKYTAGLSDEGVLAEWCENPYWQYFTGGTFFEHEFPADQASMSRWRRKLSEDGAEKLLEESLKAGLRQGFIKKSEFKRVNVDTTVAEKNIRLPTDARHPAAPDVRPGGQAAAAPPERICKGEAAQARGQTDTQAAHHPRPDDPQHRIARSAPVGADA